MPSRHARPVGSWGPHGSRDVALSRGRCGRARRAGRALPRRHEQGTADGQLHHARPQRRPHGARRAVPGHCGAEGLEYGPQRDQRPAVDDARRDIEGEPAALPLPVTRRGEVTALPTGVRSRQVASYLALRRCRAGAGVELVRRRHGAHTMMICGPPRESSRLPAQTPRCQKVRRPQQEPGQASRILFMDPGAQGYWWAVSAARVRWWSRRGARGGNLGRGGLGDGR